MNDQIQKLANELLRELKIVYSRDNRMITIDTNNLAKFVLERELECRINEIQRINYSENLDRISELTNQLQQLREKK